MGVYVSAAPLCESIGFEKLDKETGLDTKKILENYKPIPESDEQLKLTTYLANHCATAAIKRHAGKFRHTFTASGRRTWAEGKDLTKIKWLVATGGALTRLPGREEIHEKLTRLNENGDLLFPPPGSLKILEDKNYIMAALGVLSLEYPEDAKKLAKASLIMQ